MAAHSQALPTVRVLLPPASLSLRVSWDVPVRAENAIDFASTDSKLKRVNSCGLTSTPRSS
jgi:hypothetical protein